MLTIHKARILRKKSLEKTLLDFKKWVKSIQTAGFNGALTLLYELAVMKRFYLRSGRSVFLCEALSDHPATQKLFTKAEGAQELWPTKTLAFYTDNS